MAYCHWKLGHHDRAIRHARTAVEQAGDAGLLRFRVMALQLLAHIEPREARTLRRRAGRIIAELEHADLRIRQPRLSRAVGMAARSAPLPPDPGFRAGVH